MKILTIFVIAVACFFAFVYFGHLILWCLSHPYTFLKNVVVDTYCFFKYHEKNIWKNAGRTYCFFGHFGCGKSLNLTRYVLKTLVRYNGKTYIDRDTKKPVKQVFVVHSNFEIKGVPTVPFQCLNDITDTLDAFEPVDGIRTCHIFAIDEINNILNCKDYKENSNPYVLRGVMQVRKGNIQLVLSGQLPMQIEKTFRDIVDYWFECHKLWRFAWYKILDGNKVRNTDDISTIKPCGRFSWFVLNKDYNAFNTYEMIRELKKGVKEHSFISAKDIQAEADIYANTYVTKKSLRRKR